MPHDPQIPPRPASALPAPAEPPDEVDAFFAEVFAIGEGRDVSLEPPEGD